jgi:hypothetical protein
MKIVIGVAVVTGALRGALSRVAPVHGAARLRARALRIAICWKWARRRFSARLARSTGSRRPSGSTWRSKDRQKASRPGRVAAVRSSTRDQRRLAARRARRELSAESDTPLDYALGIAFATGHARSREAHAGQRAGHRGCQISATCRRFGRPARVVGGRPARVRRRDWRRSGRASFASASRRGA